MAKQADIEKGDRIFHTYNVLRYLTIEVYHSMDHFEKNEKPQHLRGMTVRTIFYFTECFLKVLKNQLKDDLALRKDVRLTEREEEILEEIRIVGGERIPWRIPIEIDVKETFALTKKLWKLEKRTIDFMGHEYSMFLKAKEAMNRLTQPGSYPDFLISDDELESVMTSYAWLRDGFVHMIQERINSIFEKMPEEYLKRAMVPPWGRLSDVVVE
jgi:hypothetical protein